MPAVSMSVATAGSANRARPLHLPAGLIDIHCHILPGVDDGPKTADVSAHMCRLARAAGTVAIVATTHANHRFVYDPCRTSALCRELECGELERSELESDLLRPAADAAPLAGLTQPDLTQSRLTQRDTTAAEGSFSNVRPAVTGPAPPLRIFRGCELELSVEALSIALASVEHYTLNGGRYLLLELLPAGMPPNLELVFARLLERGITPILAHPERSLHLHPVRLSALVKRGCLAQITGASLIGRMGPRSQAAAVELLRRRLVHFVGSDGHDPVRRPPRLIDAYQFVSQIVAPAIADRLFRENPLAVLEDQPIQAWPAF